MGFVLCLTLFSVYQGIINCGFQVTWSNLKAQACTRSDWSSWINNHKASKDPFPEELKEPHLTNTGGDRENMNETARQVFCPVAHGSVTDIQCVPALESGKNNTGQTKCDLKDGYECLNRFVDGKSCSDYRIRLYCNCTNPVTSTTAISTTTRLKSTTSKSTTTTLKMTSTMTSRPTTKYVVSTSDVPKTSKPPVKLITTSTASARVTSPSSKTTLPPIASTTSARATSPRATVPSTASRMSEIATSPSPETTLPPTKRTSVSTMREEPSVTPNKMRMRNGAASYDSVMSMTLTLILLVITAVP